MKKIIFAGLLLVTYFGNAQNPMLNAEFWKKTPDLASVKAEITKGHSPSEANRGNHDVVSFAINNNAPLETILFLIDQEGNSIDKITHDGRLYLHWASSKGNSELVKILIDKGSEINRTDDKGATPLSFGAGQPNIEVYELFFKAGISPKQTYQNGATLMHLAIANDKDLKLADYFVSKGLSLKDTDNLGNTVFHYASRSGDVELLKNLVKKGVKYDDRALIFASQGMRFSTTNLDTYKYLVETLKLKPNAVGDNGENVLHNLVRKQKQEENITYFLSKGTDINHQDKDGNTVLINSVRGELDLVKSILSKVKDVNTVNSNGTSALSQAVQTASSDVVELLLNTKANSNVIDNNGNNLAYYLIQSYRPGPVREGQKDDFTEKLNLLKKVGFDVATPQKDGSTLYHLAVAKNDLELVKKIEGFGADINAKNSEGMTALHKAALTAKDDKILKYLVEKGAKKDILTEFDETAYDLASENEFLISNKVALDFLK